MIEFKLENLTIKDLAKFAYAEHMKYRDALNYLRELRDEYCLSDRETLKAYKMAIIIQGTLINS